MRQDAQCPWKDARTQTFPLGLQMRQVVAVLVAFTKLQLYRRKLPPRSVSTEEGRPFFVPYLLGHILIHGSVK